jgi:hypothetical protein
MQKSSIALACLLMTVACSKVKELDKRTESMERSTEKVSGDTNKMKEITGIMHLQVRSGNSLATRNEEFGLLLDPAIEMGTKITSAASYFKAFEYQLWTDNQSYDDLEARGNMYLDAANEFTRRMSDLYDNINRKKMSPTKQRIKDNDEMAFYALAATIHINHHYQDVVVKKNSTLQTNSMYDMVKQSLLKNSNKKKMAEHEEVLMNGLNKEIMTELLKARVDIMAALALKNLTDKRNMTIGQKSKAAIFKITGGKLGAIDLPETYDEMNEATKDWTEKYLKAALKTQNFLSEIGVNKPLEKTLKSALRKIDFNESKMDESEKSIFDQKKENLKSMIYRLLEG